MQYPSYASLGKAGAVSLVATADTSRTAPAAAATIFTSPATRAVADAVTTISSPVVTSATAAFVLADEGRAVAGTNIVPGTTIAAYVNGTTVILSNPSLASGSALNFSVLGRGSKIEVVRFTQIISTTAAGIVHLFLYDGTTYRFLDYLSYGITTLDATHNASPIDMPFPALVMPSGWSLRAANTVASGTGSTAATHTVLAFGGDF